MRLLFGLVLDGDGWAAGFAAAKAAGKEAENGVLGFKNFLAGDFGGSFTSVFEDDGDFPNLPTAALAHKEHFDEEGVATGEDLVEGDGGKDFTAVEAKAGGGIMGVEAEEGTGDEVSDFAEPDALPTAIAGAAARDVTGADDDMFILAEFDHGRDVAGVVREIGVHGHDVVGVEGMEGEVEAGEVGGAEAEFARAVDNMDTVRVFIGP